MTTTVRVHAHNNPTRVTISNRYAPTTDVLMKDDEAKEFVVTDCQAIKVFEVNGMMDFGQALDAMKAGQRVARAGWNGKGMCIYLTHGAIDNERLSPGGVDAGAQRNGINAALFSPGDVGIVTRLPRIDMLTASGAILNGWLASQTDMLAEDWTIVPTE